MTFRWGLVGHGHISGQFLEAVDAVEGAEAIAVVGRDLGRSSAFAERHGLTVAESAGGLAAMDVDAVYICAPHTAHLAPALDLLAAGIPVLVEKPMTPTAGDTATLIHAARASRTFAMEAVWTRFLPIYDVVRGWIGEGRIGEVQSVTASFGFQAEPDASHRLFAPELAGGSVLDIGVYPLTVAEMICGPAEELRAVGQIGATCVDEHVDIEGQYPNGVKAFLSSSLRENLANQAEIIGSNGSIEIPWFFAASTATLIDGDTRQVIERRHPVNGFEYEIEHVMTMVDEGRTESTTMDFATSLRIAEACDDVRRQIGLIYPFETRS